MKKEGKKRRYATLVIVIITIGLAAFWFLYTEDTRLQVSFLDIGQGDATLIETPNKKTILIDGGPPDKAVLRQLGKELPFWERRIDLVIISHPHDDHFGGLTAVLDRYDVGAIMTTDFPTQNPAYIELLELAEQKQVPIIFPKREQTNIDGVTLHFLFPPTSLVDSNIKNANNASIVFKLSYGTMDILFTGDAELEAEAEILKSVSNELQSEILKLGHHGSDTSSSEAFLDAVKPDLAIASAGQDNSYGHPSPRIVRRLERRGINFFRTDEDRTVRFLSDGHSLFKGQTCIIGCSSL